MDTDERRLVQLTIKVWYDPILVSENYLVEHLDEAEGVEYVTEYGAADSEATYDEERGAWVVPVIEIGDGRGEDY